MALTDRIARVTSSAIHRSNHLMAAGAWMWMRGDITRSQFVAALELDASDDAHLDEIVTHYGGLNTNGKNLFFNDFSAWTVALEDGKVTAAAFRTRFDLT